MGVFNYIKKQVKSTFGNELNVPEEYKSYYKSRTIQNKKYLCHAPFSNMYFNSLGDVANCWLTFDQPEKYSEDRTIMDIWKGEKFSKLRGHIERFELEARCQKCQYYIKNENYTNVLAKAYDNDYPLGDYPTMMEFELSNTCNLECVMCTGLLSSAIRANRDHLPALKSPYGDKFVQELREFIPHLYEARFNGGEPFMIKIYYDIWDQFIELNPNCKMVIATNGTTLNKRAMSILEKGNFHINISIDSLIPERYAQIRVNSDLNKVLENFEYFKNYCQKNNRKICVMINPMRNNWEEMPEFVRFCNENNVHLWYNSIIYPEDLSLWKLPYEKLKEIYEELSKTTFEYKLTYKRGIYQYNVKTYKNLVENQIKTWMEDAKNRGEEEVEQQKAGNRVLFQQSLNDYFTRNKDNGELKTQVRQTIQQIVDRLEEHERVERFYATLCNTPIEVIIENIQNNDVETLIQKFKTIS
ncbi:MAG: radical SAM protein [Chitinophagales bacterium]|nr:radical SAM protein [Chitinophagales bacterium]